MVTGLDGGLDVDSEVNKRRCYGFRGAFESISRFDAYIPKGLSIYMSDSKEFLINDDHKLADLPILFEHFRVLLRGSSAVEMPVSGSPLRVWHPPAVFLCTPVLWVSRSVFGLQTWETALILLRDLFGSLLNAWDNGLHLRHERASGRFQSEFPWTTFGF